MRADAGHKMDFTFNAFHLAYDREIENISFFFHKAIRGSIDIDVSDYVTFNNHLSTCHGQTVGYHLTVQARKTCAFQASYFVRIVRPWNNV